LSVTCDRSVIFSCTPPIKLTAMIYTGSWNIVESDSKQNNSSHFLYRWFWSRSQPRIHNVNYELMMTITQKKILWSLPSWLKLCCIYKKKIINRKWPWIADELSPYFYVVSKLWLECHPHRQIVNHFRFVGSVMDIHHINWWHSNHSLLTT
jgi:hypothetical protein